MTRKYTITLKAPSMLMCTNIQHLDECLENHTARGASRVLYESLYMASLVLYLMYTHGSALTVTHSILMQNGEIEVNTASNKKKFSVLLLPVDSFHNMMLRRGGRGLQLMSL